MNTVKKLTILAIAVVFLALATHSFGYQNDQRIKCIKIPFGHQAGEEKHADIHNHQQVIQPAEITPKNNMVKFKSFVQFFITDSQHVSSPFG